MSSRERRGRKGKELRARSVVGLTFLSVGSLPVVLLLRKLRLPENDSIQLTGCIEPKMNQKQRVSLTSSCKEAR